MMNQSTVNKLILVGVVGREPEVYRDHQRVARPDTVTFSVATGRPDKRQSDWHRLVAHNTIARFCQDHLKPGSRVFVSGEVRYESDERDGVTIPLTWVHVKEVSLLNEKNEVIATSRHTPRGVLVNDVINTEAGHDPEEEREWE